MKPICIFKKESIEDYAFDVVEATDLISFLRKKGNTVAIAQTILFIQNAAGILPQTKKGKTNENV